MERPPKCSKEFTLIDSRCYGSCESGYEPSTEDATVCVPVGCPTSGCALQTIDGTNAFCKMVNANCTPACPVLWTESCNGTCGKFTRMRPSKTPSCPRFMVFNGVECAFQNMTVVLFFALLGLAFVLLVYQPCECPQ